MVSYRSFVIFGACLVSLVSAVPVEEAHLAPSRTHHERAINLGGIVGPIVTSVLSGLAADATDGAAIVSAIIQAAETTLGDQIPAPPADVPAAVSSLSSIFAAAPTDLVSNILDLIPAGFPTTDIANLLTASVDPRNSETNNNPDPPTLIYPKKDPRDAPYDLPESTLRQAIYIPNTFTYGQKPPVILVPGTGNTGFQTFIGNYIPLLTGVDYADPVWLNIPGQLLDDTQNNAEFVAYAINYVSSITSNGATAGKKINVLTWSQGGLISQWAFKYWVSTRAVVQNLIANSPDYHGTVLAFALAPEFPQIPSEPAVIQQQYNSDFVTTLRTNGGDAGIVPTTNIYSATDEIVEPQSPLTGASGYLLDTCKVGVTNVLIQDTCGGRGVGGTFYTHEGVLYSSLGVALALDALQKGRPAKISDLNLDTVCAQYLGQGLNLVDLFTTEESILIAALSILLYTPKVVTEPAIKAYATQSIVPVCSIPAISSTSSTVSSLTSRTISTHVTTSSHVISVIPTSKTTSKPTSRTPSPKIFSSLSHTPETSKSTSSHGQSISTSSHTKTTISSVDGTGRQTSIGSSGKVSSTFSQGPRTSTSFSTNHLARSSSVRRQASRSSSLATPDHGHPTNAVTRSSAGHPRSISMVASRGHPSNSASPTASTSFISKSHDHSSSTALTMSHGRQSSPVVVPSESSVGDEHAQSTMTPPTRSHGQPSLSASMIGSVSTKTGNAGHVHASSPTDGAWPVPNNGYGDALGAYDSLSATWTTSSYTHSSGVDGGAYGGGYGGLSHAPTSSLARNWHHVSPPRPTEALGGSNGGQDIDYSGQYESSPVTTTYGGSCHRRRRVN